MHNILVTQIILRDILGVSQSLKSSRLSCLSPGLSVPLLCIFDRVIRSVWLNGPKVSTNLHRNYFSVSLLEENLGVADYQGVRDVSYKSRSRVTLPSRTVMRLHWLLTTHTRVVVTKTRICPQMTRLLLLLARPCLSLKLILSHIHKVINLLWYNSRLVGIKVIHKSLF